MGHQFQHVQHPSQLSGLTVWRMLPWRAPDQVVIEGEGALADRARSWEKQLSNLQSACGCEQGAAGLIVGAVGYALFLLLRPGGWGHPGRREFWIGLGVMVATTSAGKFWGLLRAQRKLRQVIQEIQAHWKPRSPEAQDSKVTGVGRAGGRVQSTRCCGDNRVAAAVERPAARPNSADTGLDVGGPLRTGERSLP